MEPSGAPADAGSVSPPMALPSAPTSVAVTVPAPLTELTAPATPVALPATIPSSQPEATTTPIREDQVQNAVGFLSHPQVRSSTNTASKRSFLERKGLTAAEIDEAFRRVPEAPASAPAPTASAPAPAVPTPAAQPVTYSAPQPVAQGQQPIIPQQQPYNVPTAQTQLVASQPVSQVPGLLQGPAGYRWSQLVLGVGVVAAAGWAVHQLLVPRLRTFVDKWHAQRREAEEAREKALATALESLKGCQEELKTSTQALVEVVALMREQQQQQQQQRAAASESGMATRGPGGGRQSGASPIDNPYVYYPNGRNGGNGRYGNEVPYGGSSTLGAETFAALRAAAGYTNAYPPDSASYGYGRDSGPPTAGPTGGDGSSRTAPGAPVYSVPTQSFGAGRAAAAAANGPYGGSSGPAQENLPYKVTAPPSPAHSTHSLQSGRQQQQQQQQAPGGYGGGMGGTYGSSDRLYESSFPGSAAAQEGGDGGRSVPRAPPEQPAYPQSFHEVMEMVQKGITPPNVRTDINDAPPDPTRPLSEARMPAPLKPWERASTSASGPALPATGGSVYGSAKPTTAYGGWGGSPADAAGAVPAPSSSSQPLNLPPTTYGGPAGSPGSGGGGGSGGSAAGGTTGGRASGSGGSGTGLSVLPPVNPAWRPPPPPARTVTPSNPSSPPSISGNGMAPSASTPASLNGGAAEAGPAAAGATGSAAASASAGPAAGPSAAAPAPAAIQGTSFVPLRAVSEPPLAAAPVMGQGLTVSAGPGGGAGADMAPTSPTPSQPAFAPTGGEMTAMDAFADGLAGGQGAEGPSSRAASVPAATEAAEQTAAAEGGSSGLVRSVAVVPIQ